ncbi:MAG: Abnormal spindle-like microcephaly-assocd, ASPM-SPD-2-Hydin [Actinomycetota bacterium]|nr:Abnormal spindle-like microcephaly-assocd, ASPM-SPD-2-Hydin [Actinomycetota bacterium]MEA2971821.1 Abnormal spindle-like microcephaly-assocd, ASPM-SPD-2-Hydin [Actinomycetota bacterium]
MSDGKPFWSSAPGVVTGIASIVTAIVGVLGISVQAGWIGGDDSKASSNDGVTTTTASTLPGATTRPGATTVPVKQGEFEVDPDSVTFEPLQPKEATVVVRNIGDVPLTMRKPTIAVGSTAFTASDASCTTAPLPPDGRCEVLVTFTATQPGDYTGVLVVAAANAPKQVEVDLKGSRGLLG